jgi:hypothetical protein
MIRQPTTSEVLNNLVQQGILTDSVRLELEQIPIEESAEHALWFVQVLAGLGAWIAAGFFLAFLFLTGIIRSQGSDIDLGLIMIVATTVLRGMSHNVFLKQLSMAGSIAGQVLSIGGVIASTHSVSGGAFFALGLEITLLAIYPDMVMRFLTAAGVFGAIFTLVLETHEPFLVDLVVVAAIVGGGLIWLAPPRCERTFFGDRRLPVAYGFLLFGLGLLGANVIMAQETYYKPWMLLQPTTVGLSIFFVLFLLSVFRTYRVRIFSEPSIVALVAIGLICAATLNSPGVIASLATFALAFQRRSKLLFGLGSIFLAGFVIFFYYSLNTTFLAKSGMLLGAGLILLALRFYFLARWRVAEEQTS